MMRENVIAKKCEKTTKIKNRKRKLNKEANEKRIERFFGQKCNKARLKLKNDFCH